ncbi:MAG: putative photosynthetic complex assembly protein PuhE [Pseudomonadota bacterium]
MSDYLTALLAVAIAWWLSTGIVLLLNRQRSAVQKISALVVSGLVILALFTVPAVSADRTSTGALTGFAQGLLFWGWLEMIYLMGFVTGSRNQPCPEQTSLPKRFMLGLQTSIHHELTVVAALVVVAVLSSSGGNLVALAVLAALSFMRWSAKLNLFLGVRNYNDDWFPEHLHYLDSYTRRAPMNALFPLSVTAGTVVAAVLLSQGIDNPDPYSRTSMLMVSALVSLGVLEHWFLMIPFGESALWNWALPDRTKAPAVNTPALKPPTAASIPR